MKRCLLAILFISLYGSIGWANQVNLDSLYRVLDAAIDSSSIYKKQKLDAINTLEKQYAAVRNDQDRYQFALSLFRANISPLSMILHSTISKYVWNVRNGWGERICRLKVSLP